MEEIFVVGSAGHALVVLDMLEKAQRYLVAGLLDPFRRPGETVAGYQVLGGQADIPELSAAMGVKNTMLAIGDNWDRSRVYEEIAGACPDVRFPICIHPAAHIGSNVTIGEGSVVMPGAVINSGCRIGRFCVVNSAATVEHECNLEDFSSIAPGAILGGNVTIGRYSSVSLGAHVVHKVSIGRHVVVGAGALVLDDVTDQVIAHGTPARKIRTREIGEGYL